MFAYKKYKCYVCFMITLNESATELIRGNRQLKKAIINELDCTEKTLYNDLKSANPKLTQVGIINIIVEHTGRPLSELIKGGAVSKLLGK